MLVTSAPAACAASVRARRRCHAAPLHRVDGVPERHRDRAAAVALDEEVRVDEAVERRGSARSPAANAAIDSDARPSSSSYVVTRANMRPPLRWRAIVGIASSVVYLCRVDLKLLEAVLAELGEPAYRAGQVWEWTARAASEGYEAMTNLPHALRAALASRASRSRRSPSRRSSARATAP